MRRLKLQKLQRTKASAFDRGYVSAQIDGHQQLLELHESYIASGKNLINRSLAKLARGQVKEHLALLSTANKLVKRG
jgi:putative membrane protein